METFIFVLEFLTYWLVDQYWFPVFDWIRDFLSLLDFPQINTLNMVGESLVVDM